MTNNKPIGVYVHWPFCKSLCPYCDFNSHLGNNIDHAQWAQSYLKEIDHFQTLVGARPVSSIFFGGGTPSLMQPQTVEAIINHLQKHWGFTPDIEITLEANPTSIEAEKFKEFAAAGVNRVSIGIQSFIDSDLKFLGREHSAHEAQAALDIGQKYFERMTFDLIYALPGQTLDSWEQELRTALARGTDHLSLYQLTIEQGTPFYMRHKRGEFQIPDEQLAADLFELTQELTSAAGLPMYEISNHARSGQESRHNLTYWRYEDFAGIGPGAHGRVTTLDGQKFATTAHRAPQIYLERVAQHGHGLHPLKPIPPRDQFDEFLLMNLRLVEGISITRLTDMTGQSFEELWPTATLQPYYDEDLLWKTATHFGATASGLRCLNTLTSNLLNKAKIKDITA